MPAPKSQLSRSARNAYHVGYGVARAAIGAVMLLPYRLRVPLTGRLTARVIGPIAGFHRRTRHNLGLVCPDLPAAEVRRLCRAVADNAGRSAIEQLSTDAFQARAQQVTMSGPGWEAVEQARAEGRPVIMCSGHFGNYSMIRAAFQTRGYDMGVFYRRMANPYFNRYYVSKLEALGQPCFEQGLEGMRGVVKHLRKGGMLGILTDLHAHGGEELQFFGKPAVTALSTAELALKFNALLVPGYAIRQPDGLNFEVRLNPPIPLSDARTMSQAMNDDLEDMVRAYMDQWFWIHRRWKPWVAHGVVRGLPEG